MRRALAILGLWGACLLGGGAVQAAGLQVSPVTLTLAPTRQGDGLWLSNTGTAPLDAQIRVFRWTQVDGQDRMEPADGLVVSPPMLQLPTDGRQLVRVIRNGPPPAGPAEEAYRVLVDELPVPQAAGAAADGKKSNLNFVMRHSLPIFVSPAGAEPAPAQLRWSLRREDGKAVLEVSNGGGVHAQLADLVFTGADGRAVAAYTGLLGYVLPGATMRWPLKTSPAALVGAGRWQVMIDGRTTDANLAPLAR
ncbi:molecular chaperone [Variovorax sp. V118]|uniref:fimbrial biogenesis chaperone n=1 Tax=Variovorax sp. V118 TaxID=3065954 RepID=UPI0034E86E78